jgi:hypothetical protein
MVKSDKHINSAGWRAFEFVLLCVVLCVLAIRVTYPESPNTTSIMSGQILGNAAFSLIITSVLVFCFAAWVIFAFINGKVRYRFNWIEVGTVIFIAGGVVAVPEVELQKLPATALPSATLSAVAIAGHFNRYCGPGRGTAGDQQGEE